jgi:hypothetical protein
MYLRSVLYVTKKSKSEFEFQKSVIHQRAIFDLVYPIDCQFYVIHDYSYCILAYATLDDTAQKHEF